MRFSDIEKVVMILSFNGGPFSSIAANQPNAPGLKKQAAIRNLVKNGQLTLTDENEQPIDSEQAMQQVKAGKTINVAVSEQGKESMQDLTNGLMDESGNLKKTVNSDTGKIEDAAMGGDMGGDIGFGDETDTDSAAGDNPFESVDWSNRFSLLKSLHNHR